MYLKWLDPPPPDAGQFGRSGLWINAEDGGYKVAGIVAGSPATVAGLIEGDVILGIDGQPVETARLSDAREMLRTRPAGATLAIVFRRNGVEHTTTLTLRDHI